MRTIILFAISVMSLATHADAIDDVAEAGGKLLVEAHDNRMKAYDLRERRKCRDEARDKDACGADEAQLRRTARELVAQASQMVPTNTGINFSRDQKSLSTDDLMWELMDRAEGKIRHEAELKKCLKNTPKYCAEELKYRDFYVETYAKAKGYLLEKDGNTIFAKKETKPTDERLAASLEELKDQNVTKDYSLPFGPLDEKTGSARFASGGCDFKLAVKNGFTDYKEVWESKTPMSWKVGEFSPGEKLSRGNSDNEYGKALTRCQSFEPEVREKCTSILRANGTYQGSGFVLLTSDTKTLAVSSKDNENGIYECLKSNGFAMPMIKDPSKQTAGDTKAAASR